MPVAGGNGFPDRRVVGGKIGHNQRPVRRGDQREGRCSLRHEAVEGHAQIGAAGDGRRVRRLDQAGTGQRFGDAQAYRAAARNIEGGRIERVRRILQKQNAVICDVHLRGIGRGYDADEIAIGADVELIAAGACTTEAEADIARHDSGMVRAVAGNIDNLVASGAEQDHARDDAAAVGGRLVGDRDAVAGRRAQAAASEIERDRALQIVVEHSRLGNNRSGVVDRPERPGKILDGGCRNRMAVCQTIQRQVAGLHRRRNRAGIDDRRYRGVRCDDQRLCYTAARARNGCGDRARAGRIAVDQCGLIAGIDRGNEGILDTEVGADHRVIVDVQPNRVVRRGCAAGGTG